VCVCVCVCAMSAGWKPVSMRAAALAVLSLSVHASAQNQTRVMLDSIARLVDGSVNGLEDELFDDIMACMAQAPNLVESHEAAWAGFESYFLTNGTGEDGWGACNAAAGCKQYKESNLTAMDVDAIGIYEPCNSASNLAYYRTAIGVCDHDGWAMSSESQTALIQSYIHLAMGSFFWHGSHSFLGNVADNRIIDVFAFIAYQVTIANFLDPDGDQTTFAVLRDLNTTLRSASADESAQALTDMFITEPIDTWQAYIENLDMPNYYVTFAALVGNVLSLICSDDTVDTIFDAMAEAFNLPPDMYDFMTETYFPTLRTATVEKGIALSRLERVGLAFKMSGTLVKMMYAFLWQEWVFVFGPNDQLMLRPRVNKLGAALMPGVNAFANLLTGYKHTDPNVQNAEDVYPGDARCRIQEAHSKWHEQGGNGLLDLMMLADDAYALTSKAAQRRRYDDKHGMAGGWANFAVEMVTGWQRTVGEILGL